MDITKDLYRSSLALFTDLYQITMAYGYQKAEIEDTEAVFHLYFRKNPFKGGFALCCGLGYVIDYLKNFKISQDDLAYLAQLRGNDGDLLFDASFLQRLSEMEFLCDVDAIPEGTVVFPHEPLLRISGPLFQCQLIESALLNIINFQTLLATKASRLCLAAKTDPVLEFGMRRAQGIDGAISASRAAYIGGCAGTSNVLAGKLFGIPVKGTHAHSWIMAFPSECDAFEAYAKAMPNNCTFLVDTYGTIEGVKNALKSAQKLRRCGHKPIGIRLDSGDLAYLSIKAREMLDEAGFPDMKIVASNDLDEHIILSLKTEQEAKIDIWGVGTKLAAAYDQPALGGVYKMAAIRKKNGEWEHKIKLSEQKAKISNPGIQQVRRFFNENQLIADMIYNSNQTPPKTCTIIDPMDDSRRKKIAGKTAFKDLLVPIFRRGKLVYRSPNIHEIRKTAAQELRKVHPTILRFKNPHNYPVGLEKGLHALKNELIFSLKGFD